MKSDAKSAAPVEGNANQGAGAFASAFSMDALLLWRSSKLRTAALAVVLTGGASLLAIGLQDDMPTEDVVSTLRQSLFRLIAYFFAFLFYSGAVADEIEKRTLPLISARSLSKFSLALAKYASATLFALSCAILSAALIALSATLLSDYEVSAALIATGGFALTVPALGSYCMLAGSLAPRASGIASVVILLIDFSISLVPGFLPLISLGFHGQTASQMLSEQDLSTDLFGTVITTPTFDSWIHCAILVAMSLIVSVLTALVFQTREYRDAEN